MNVGYSRRTTPKVKNGKVQRKNKCEQSPNYYLKRRDSLLIERRKPGKGFRHLLTRDDIEGFIELIPGWDELSLGLNAVVLNEGSYRWLGYHVHGVVHISAWEEGLWQDFPRKFFEENFKLLERLKVPNQELPDKQVRCFFNEENAKAFQLLDVFLHELGHHHDCITNKSKICCPRGEPYAEQFALRYQPLVYAGYVKRFEPMFARGC